MYSLIYSTGISQYQLPMSTELLNIHWQYQLTISTFNINTQYQLTISTPCINWTALYIYAGMVLFLGDYVITWEFPEHTGMTLTLPQCSGMCYHIPQPTSNAFKINLHDARMFFIVSSRFMPVLSRYHCSALTFWWHCDHSNYFLETSNIITLVYNKNNQKKECSANLHINTLKIEINSIFWQQMWTEKNTNMKFISIFFPCIP